MNVEVIVENPKDVSAKVALIRLVPKTEQEKEFLRIASKEGLRVFKYSSSGAIGLHLPTEANLKQIHIPEKVFSWINEVVREGI